MSAVQQEREKKLWIVWSCASIILYALCEIYQKKGSDIEEPFSEIKILVWFGLVALIVAAVVSFTGLRESSISFIEMTAENPAMILSTIFYFLSLWLAFLSLKLLPVSVEVPIVNSCGYFAFIGIILLYMVLGKYDEIVEAVTPAKLLLVIIIFSEVTFFLFYIVIK